ncbi:hypothetical protein [Cellulomonas shaoxiangyii]|uniref:ESX-1 secretion-associated protein n=1 Tax=Cellulomonas shaoxiangyii TaxID=2566013 RepID=A0A4P7SNN5_9CELL|nr:hypothetical protein [Cellulomonas shaoxiangyii]QCB94233.1 hypothetical protein E5225_12345 [Cellulomonas shaoxiangyii]TGY86726.1 hypothetical protein E5226_01305 [Cellulomonas shaoxiangyii]
MSQDRIVLDSDVINAHVGRVRSVSTDIGTAHSAAGGLNLGGGAFGVLCAVLVPPAQLVSQRALGAIQEAQDLVDRSADQIAAVVADFAALEEEIRAELEPISSAVQAVQYR